jgi:peptide/nickel transport system substrate-binding protein
VDDYTVKFTLSYPSPLDLVASANYAAWIFSPKAYEEKGPDWFNEGHAPAPPLPHRPVRARLAPVMSANADYWGGWKDGQFKKVVFELIEDPPSPQRMIESGEADFTYQLPADNLDAIRQNPNLVVYQNPAFLNLVGLFNTVKTPAGQQTGAPGPVLLLPL